MVEDDNPSTASTVSAGTVEKVYNGCDNKSRFILELEFVQCLCNPAYLNWLAQTHVLEDAAFVNYLKYLQYWRKADYCIYLKYPHCLLFLDLLQSDDFRRSIANGNIKEFVHQQQFYFWSYFRQNRIKEQKDEGLDGA